MGLLLDMTDCISFSLLAVSTVLALRESNANLSHVCFFLHIATTLHTFICLVLKYPGVVHLAPIESD